MATTWSTTDKQQNTLSNGNLTATATAGGFSSGRTNVSWAAGKVYLEIVLGGPSAGPSPWSSEFSAEFGSGSSSTVVSNNMLVGIANASWNLFSQLGQASPSNSVGVAVGNFDEVYVNEIFFSGGVHPCVVGDTVSMAVDYGIDRYWYSTDQMQTDIGAGAWNNSLTDNPATGAGGLDFSSQAGPFFGAWFSDLVGSSVTINAHAPWHRAIPAGFTAADGGASSGVILVTQAAETGVITGGVTVAGIIGGSIDPFTTDFTSDFGSGLSIYTQAPDTMSGAGTVTLPARTGAISATQSPQTLSGTGIVSASVVNFGPIIVTQGAQTMVATGTVTTIARIGSISVVEAPDTMTGVGFIGIQVGIPFVEWMS